MELWHTVAEAVCCTRVAQKLAAVSADEFRSPNVKLLLGSDACVEHADNGIRFVNGWLFTVRRITVRRSGEFCSSVLLLY